MKLATFLLGPVSLLSANRSLSRITRTPNGRVPLCAQIIAFVSPTPMVPALFQTIQRTSAPLIAAHVPRQMRTVAEGSIDVMCPSDEDDDCSTESHHGFPPSCIPRLTPALSQTQNDLLLTISSSHRHALLLYLPVYASGSRSRTCHLCCKWMICVASSEHSVPSIVQSRRQLARAYTVEQRNRLYWWSGMSERAFTLPPRL